MAAIRRRCADISAESLAALLLPFVRDKGPRFVNYDGMNAKLNAKQILSSMYLWRAIRRDIPTLLLKQVVVEQSLKIVIDELQMQPFDVRSKALALRGQARAILQTTTRTPGAAWLAELWGTRSATPTEAADDAHEHSAPQQASEDDEEREESEEHEGHLDDEGHEEHEEHDDEAELEHDLGGEPDEPATKKKPAALVPPSDELVGYDHEQRRAWRASADKPKEKAPWNASSSEFGLLVFLCVRRRGAHESKWLGALGFMGAMPPNTMKNK